MNSRRNTRTQRLTRLMTAVALATSALGLVGCNEEHFEATRGQVAGVAPGNFVIQPKVDILLIEDDTGSAYETYDAIAVQTKAFLADLEARGWNYRFATVPLTTDRPISEVITSKHDGNWGSQWVAPYPGATIGTADTINPSVFRRTENYNGFIYSDISVVNGGHEPGFETIRRALLSRAPAIGFLRPDALLAIVVMSAGKETSYVNICRRSGDPAKWIECDSGLADFPYGTQAQLCTAPQYAFTQGQDPYNFPGADPYNSQNNGCKSGTQSYNYFKGQFSLAKANPAQIKMFAAVSTAGSDNRACAIMTAGGARSGQRYMSMANDFGGAVYDVCTQPISQVLSGVSTNLTAQRIAFRTRYLFLNREPNPSSIRVCRGHQCAAGYDADEIPQNASNGWTYAGNVTNVYAIDAPVPMNLGSGYAIELHGTAKLHGDETVGISFLAAGSGSSSG